jgi:hypothetical protein
MDEFVYEFDVWKYEAEIGNFDSVEMSRERCSCQCDDVSSEKKGGFFTVNATVQCWGPADIDYSGVGTDTDSYTCGNDACYKLTDPADDGASSSSSSFSLVSSRSRAHGPCGANPSANSAFFRNPSC